MSARNKLENKKKRREEREIRKAEFHRKYNLPPLQVDFEAIRQMQAEARLAEKGFIVAHQEDMLWKPGDED